MGLIGVVPLRHQASAQEVLYLWTVATPTGSARPYSGFYQRSQVGSIGAKNVKLFLCKPLYGRSATGRFSADEEVVVGQIVVCLDIGKPGAAHLVPDGRFGDSNLRGGTKGCLFIPIDNHERTTGL